MEKLNAFAFLQAKILGYINKLKLLDSITKNIFFEGEIQFSET